ncbi:MAG: methyltransferase domain-containing protein [Chthoniobacterales bacterium]|nr:methyltransferase domain-containing protein [Chthoniobacterales bacterium]
MAAHPKGANWWQVPLVRQHINRLVAGLPCGTGASAGTVALLKRLAAGRVFRRAISVGAGVGIKEMLLLQNGLVEEVDLFELSSKRIAEGQERATKLGLDGRVHFHSSDAFQSVAEASVDLVYWNNALHHMFDVEEAVKWSYSIMETGGLFYMDDFVGPNRRQWSQKALALGSRIREILPERYLRKTVDDKAQTSLLPRQLVREDPQRIAAQDPSEAVDSQNIMAAVRRFFPKATIIPTGGVVYHMTLSRIFPNFDPEDERDKALLEALLLVDELCLEIPGLETHYCVAAGWKD